MTGINGLDGNDYFVLEISDWVIEGYQWVNLDYYLENHVKLNKESKSYFTREIPIVSNIKQHRIDYVLNKKFEFNGVIQTRKDWLNSHADTGAKAELGESVPKFNHKRYNNLTGDAQKSYYDKAHKVSPEYQLWYCDKSYYVITKTEYEYYINLDKGIPEIKFDPYQEVLKISGVSEIIEKLQTESYDDLWWTIAEELYPLLSDRQLRTIDDKHHWSLSD